MRFDHLHVHQQLSRRQVLKLGVAAAGTVRARLRGALGEGGGREPSVEAAAKPPLDPSWGDTEFSDPHLRPRRRPGVEGRHVQTRPRADDQIGTWNEVKPFRTRKALDLLDARILPKTYTLGEEMFNGFPAYPSIPPRLHEQRLLVTGNPVGTSGAIQSLDANGLPVDVALGPNMLTGHEERFSALTYQIATQTDGLNHVGVGTTYYNGVQFEDMLAAHGTLKLGGEQFPPIVTRGLILDIVGLKVDLEETNDLSTAPNGEKILRDDYRITLSDRRRHAPRPHLRDPSR